MFLTLNLFSLHWHSFLKSVKKSRDAGNVRESQTAGILGTAWILEDLGTDGMLDVLGIARMPKVLGTAKIPEALGTAGMLETLGTALMPDALGTAWMPEAFGTAWMPETFGTAEMPKALVITRMLDAFGTAGRVETLIWPQLETSSIFPAFLNWLNKSGIKACISYTERNWFITTNCKCNIYWRKTLADLTTHFSLWTVSPTNKQAYVKTRKGDYCCRYWRGLRWRIVILVPGSS